MEIGKPQREYILTPHEIPVPMPLPVEPATPAPARPELQPVEQPAAA